MLRNYKNSNAIEAYITHFISKKKPIATMCAGIDYLRDFWEGGLLTSEVKELSAEEFRFDADNNIYYTPVFRKTGSCYAALSGIDSMIYALSQAQTTF